MSKPSPLKHALPYQDQDDPLVSALHDEAIALDDFQVTPFKEWEEDLSKIEEELRAAREKAGKPKAAVMVPAGEQGKLLHEMMRASPAFFAHEILTGPPQLPYNGRFLVSEHHEAWDDLIIQYKRICIEAARDHGKTFFFDFAYPLWKVSMFPGSIGFIFSGTAPQAIRILGDIKAEIEGNPRLRWLQPKIKRGVQWSSTCIQCSNGSRIYARGFGTRVRGAHPDWIVVDDGLNDETIYSETVRLKQIDYFYSAISNMLVPGGQLIVVGTPFHQQDLYSDLENNSEYKFGRFPALDVAGNPLWPERYDAAALAAKQREVGTIRFTREFLCQPIADDMSLFPQYLFEGEKVEQPTVVLGAPLEFWKSIGIESVAMGVDFAWSTSAKADYTVIWVMGRDAQGNRWIMDIVRGHGAAYQSQLSRVNEVARLYEPGIIFVESNQAQQIYGDELIRTTDLPIHKFVTGVQKHALDKGVPSLRVLLENGKFKIPRGDKRSVEMTNLWRDEMRAFTWANGKLASVINHDDTVMACIGPGALVTTYWGKKPIEQVVCGDLVLTHAGNWQRVTGVMRRNYLGKAYQLRASGGRSFLITNEHPVFTAHPMRDTVVNNQRLLPNPATWDFRKADEVRAGRKMNGDYVLLPIPRWPIWEGKLDLADFVTFNTPLRGGNCWKKDEQFIWWRGDRKVSRHFQIDEDLGFLIGLYLAEGSSMGHQIHFALHYRETYIQDFILRITHERFNALGGVSVTGNGRVVWVSSIPVARLFQQFGSRREKGLPNNWMGLPLSVRLAIVRGWLVGDGCLGKRKGSTRHSYLKAVTISQTLLDQMVWTLREAGVTPTIGDFSNKQPAWILLFSEMDTTRFLRNMNSIEQQRWAIFQPTERTTPTNSRSIAQTTGIATRVAECAELEYEGLVFNLQIEGDESYVVEDVAVHNCWICEQAIRHGGFAFDFGDDIDYDSAQEKVVAMEEVMRELTEDTTNRTDELPKATGNLIDDNTTGDDTELDGDLPMMRGVEQANAAALRGTWE